MQVPNLTPTGNLVAIEIKKQTVSASGLDLSAVKDENPTREGIVYVKGPKANDVAVGDYVIFPNFIGMEITIDTTKCIMVYEDDILAVIQ